MPQLTVRNVPEEVVEALREEASQGGISINAVARAALQEHVERLEWRLRVQRVIPEMDALRARIAERHGGLLEESWPLIREDRDR